MKSLSQVIIGIVFMLIISHPFKGNVAVAGGESTETNIKILCTSDMYALVTAWAADYEKCYTGMAVSVEILDEIGRNGPSGENLCIMPSWNYASHAGSPGLEVLIGHDVTVPVVSNRNPYIDKLSETGITLENLAGVLTFSDKTVWGSVVTGAGNDPITIYMANSGPVQASIEKLSGDMNIHDTGIRMTDGIDLIRAIQDDPYAIGFLSLGSLAGHDENELFKSIRLLPVDRNGNGRMDYMEDIYANLSELTRGIWIGKYPRALVHNIYITTEAVSLGPAELAFIGWVLDDGQPVVEAAGHSSLANSERLGQLAKIMPAPPVDIPAVRPVGIPEIIAFILSGLAVISLLAYILINRLKRARPRAVKLSPDITNVFSEKTVEAPGGLHYDRTHTWAFMEKDGSVRIGIDDFLQNITGTVSRLILKTGGEKVRRGEPLLTLVQRGKKLTIYAPVTGTVKKENTRLWKDSSLINTSPYEEGWIYLIEPETWDVEVARLKPAVKYREWLKAEFARFKDFLTAALSDKQLNMSLVVLQDGGVIRSSILSELGPETWEDFQVYFLDLSK